MIEISSPQQPVETKIITRKRLLTNVTMSRWSLPLILAFQALLSWILLQNTAFQDEALYIYAGRQIWQQWLGGPPSLDHYSYYFSGYPYVYAIIGGGLDMVGGLVLARSFSLACMLVVTACGYYVTKSLFNQKSAIGAGFWREICGFAVYPTCSFYPRVMYLAQTGMDKHADTWNVGSTVLGCCRSTGGYYCDSF